MRRGQSEMLWIDKWVTSKSENGWTRAKVAIVPCKPCTRFTIDAARPWLKSERVLAWQRWILPIATGSLKLPAPSPLISSTSDPLGLHDPLPKKQEKQLPWAIDLLFLCSIALGTQRIHICLMLSSQNDVLTRNDQIRKPTSKAAAIMAWIESSCKSLATSMFQIEVQRWCASRWNDNSTLQH